MQLGKTFFNNFNAYGTESKGYQFKAHKSLGKT